MMAAKLAERNGFKVDRLATGLYKATMPSGHVYYIEDVTDELGPGQPMRAWSVSQQKTTADGVLYRDEPRGVASTVCGAVYMISRWRQEG
jgi:hypothetical protein